MGELPQRRCQRDDLPAAAAIPSDGLGRKSVLAGRHRRDRGFGVQHRQAMVRRLVRPHRLSQGTGAVRLCPGRRHPAVDRDHHGTVATSCDPAGRSDRQGNSELAPRCAHCRFRRSRDSGTGLRFQPCHGSPGGSRGADPGSGLPLVLPRPVPHPVPSGRNPRPVRSCCSWLSGFGNRPGRRRPPSRR